MEASMVLSSRTPFLNIVFCVWGMLLTSTYACNGVEQLPDLERRARTVMAGEPYVNDFILTEGWYSVIKNGEQYLMPDSSKLPGYSSCGTLLPVYMKGAHVALEDMAETPMDVTVCYRDTFDDCGFEFIIKVRKCNDHIQYYLPYTGKTNAGYCFDPPSLQDIETEDFTPAPTNVIYGVIEVLPELLHREQPKHIPVDGVMTDTINYVPYLKFHCRFSEVVPHEYYYTVHWFANENSIYSTQEQSVSELYLLESVLLEKKIPIGVVLKCGVQASVDQNGLKTTMESSEGYKTGIKILNPVVNIPKSSTGEEVIFQLTVPLGCGYNSHIDTDCKVGLRMVEQNSGGYKCGQGNIVEVKNNGLCGKELNALKNGDDWSKDNLDEYTFTIQSVDENTADSLGYSLHLSTEKEQYHEWWRDYQPGTIAVIIENDVSYKDSICYSHVDPHNLTPDGYHYENQKEGKYVLYRHGKYGIEIQEKTMNCNNNKARCTCAIAIRAGGDVFKINLCDEKNFIGFVSCTDGGILKVVNKTESRYYVYTPIGTWVDINMHTSTAYTGFMNVDIYMSPKDFKQTKGLCGVFDGDYKNDLLRRDGGTSTTMQWQSSIYKRHHLDFTDSWMVKTTEGDFDLIDEIPRGTLPLWSNQNGMFCVCEFDKDDPDSAGRAICKGTQYLDCISYDTSAYKYCPIGNRRRKRNTSPLKEERELERLIRWMSDGTDVRKSRPQVQKRNADDYIITEADAMGNCTAAINSSFAVTYNSDSLGREDPNIVIDQCAFDVQAGNDLSLGQAHVDALNGIIQKVFDKDPVFVENNTERVEAFIKNSCPSNCSNSGICTDEGICACEPHRKASDCSIDVRDPLYINDVEGGGLCNLTDGDGCTCFTLRTTNLLPNFTCEISTASIYIDGSADELTTVIEVGEYEDIFTGLCCVPQERKRRSANTSIVFVTRYDLALSNNGINFGSSEPLYVYNSLCQVSDDDGNGGYIIKLKDDSCYIDGECVLDNEHMLSDDCFACDSSTNQYNWTVVCEHTEDNSENKTWVIVVAVTVPICCITIVVVLIVVYSAMTKQKRAVHDSQLFSSQAMQQQYKHERS